MKVVYYLCYALIVNSFIGIAWACPTYSSNTTLIAHTSKTKPIAKPKLSTIQSSESIKLASVYFIAGDSLQKGEINDGGGVNIKPTKCPTGQTLYNGQCVTPCDTLKYPYTIPFSPTETISPTCAEVLVCNSSNISRYGCTSCREGYVHKGNKCEATDCNDYPLPSLDFTIGTGGCKICGSTSKCKYTSCEQGYDLSGGDCVVHECEPTKYSYSPEVKPDYNIGTPVYCYTGKTSLWGYGSCRSGYSLSNGACINACNYTNTLKPDNCATVDSCMKNGTTYYASTCTKCNDGSTYWCSDAWRCLIPIN